MQFWSIQGYIPYEIARRLQLELLELRVQGLIPDTVLFLEHSPVITRGRGLQFTGTPRPRHMPGPVGLPPEIEFAESERGGDLTFHGPGQLVIYPICKLEAGGFAGEKDIAGFIRNLERLLIDELLSYGLNAHAQENASGVWVDDKKIASLGIAVRKWVSYHGLALNCVNDLSFFKWISPCGFNPEVMTRLMDWIPQSSNWRARLEQALANRMSKENPPQIRSLSVEEAFEELKAL